MNGNIYIDSMIDQRRTAGLNRQLEYRRIAEERGTLKTPRTGIVARLAAALTHRAGTTRTTRTAHMARHA